MTKHFEKLWEEGEELASHWQPSSGDPFSEITKEATQLSNSIPSERSLQIGKLLFAICKVSGQNNINVYAALQQVISDVKTDILE